MRNQLVRFARFMYRNLAVVSLVVASLAFTIGATALGTAQAETAARVNASCTKGAEFRHKIGDLAELVKEVAAKQGPIRPDTQKFIHSIRSLADKPSPICGK